MLADELVIHPESRYATCLGNRSYEAKEGLFNEEGSHIGYAMLHTGELVDRHGVYTPFGRLNYELERIKRKEPYHHYWLVELQSPQLAHAVFDRRPVASLLEAMRASLVGTIESAMDKQEFRSYEHATMEDKQRQGATRLRQRQLRAQTAYRVFYDARPVMLVPSNENEVIALVCKLECLGALPLRDFTLWEYTARIGIDALASFQLSETEVPTQFGSVELEFNYENFFDHGHPHQHVNLVICWSFRDGEAPQELQVRGDLGNGFYEFQSRQWSFVVLVLAEIESLDVRR